MNDWLHEIYRSLVGGCWEIEPMDHHEKWGNDDIITDVTQSPS